MDILELILISAIPSTLVVLGGLLVLHRAPEEKAGRNFLIYLLACVALADLIILLGTLFWKTPYDQANFYLTYSLLPVLVGLLALAMLHLGKLRSLGWRQIALGALALLILTGLGAVLLKNENDSFLTLLGYIFVLGMVLGLAWAGGLRWKWLEGIFLLLVLAGLVSFNEPVVGWLSRNMDADTPKILGIAFSAIRLSISFLTVPLIAVLVMRALKPRVQAHVTDEVAEQYEEAQPSSSRRPQRWASILQLGAAALLLAGLLYTIYWTSIWDHTSDGLGGIFLTYPGAILGIGAGILMTIFSAGWRRLAGLLFMVLVPLLLMQALRFGWQASYHAITEERAARIAAALAKYHDRAGAYPQELKELAPRDLLFIPQPVILQGEPWCYQGDADSYRLGAVFREYFSSPLSIQVYASSGEPLESGWACDARLEELKEIHDAHFAEPPAYPPEERLPQSEVIVSRQTLEPAVEGTSVVAAHWSPDGRYLTFSDDTRLQILDVSEGTVCTGDREVSLFDNPDALTAWLPDGELLIVTQEGNLASMFPCEAAQPLTGGEAANFSEVLAADPTSGSVLLEAEGSFWILDGDSLALKLVEGVTPNPYELHWDQAAWLSGGSRLAISRLNGRNRSEGSTLYIIDGVSGEAQLSLPRPYASDQSAPHVEWLSKDELLISGDGVLALLDLTANPPQEIDVMQDLFGLDLAYPDDISGMGSLIDRQGGGYYLAVRANHPRNQSLYLYSAASGQVQAFEHPMHSLLFFPDGQMLWMPKFENEPTYQDEYELVWVGEPNRPVEHLSVTGHTPRDYPMLFVEPAPGGKSLYFGSSQGVSLVSLPNGEMLAFWDLGGGTAYVTGPKDADAGQRFVAVVDGVGLFIIPEFSK